MPKVLVELDLQSTVHRLIRERVVLSNQLRNDLVLELLCVFDHLLVVGGHHQKTPFQLRHLRDT